MTVYVAARDLAGVPFGTHQFIVITYPQETTVMVGNRVYTTRRLGSNIQGLVFGAQNRGTLAIEFFEKADTIAAREFFSGKKTVWYRSDYDTEMKIVTFNGSSFSFMHERHVLSLTDAYHVNQTLDPILYPRAGIGYNSNSWAQSLIHHAGGKVGSNFRGADIFHHRKIPKTYFLPFCPSKPREKLNQ